jgi:Fe-S cluster assembly protein SufD
MTTATAVGAVRGAGDVMSGGVTTASANAGLKAMRSAALELVGALAVPTTHDEAWRFTSIAALNRASLHAVVSPTPLTQSDIAGWAIPEAAQRIVFVDGVHAPQLGTVATTDGVVVSTLAQALLSHPAAVMQHLGQHAADPQHRFTAQNTANLFDAAVVIAPRNTAASAPVHLLFIDTQPNVNIYARTLVIAEEGSTLTLIEDYVALTDGAYLTNSVTELAIGANAQIHHIRLQRESQRAFHIARCALTQAQDSHYHCISIALGAEISRVDTTAQLRGTGVHCALDGLAHIAGQQVADTHTRITHEQAHGTSRQLHKCIVADTAHAVFNGRVQVHPGAQKTDSAQSSRTLLMGPKAQVNTLPQLEINADDVRCTHGATVGQLDSEEVFYLQSRGLSPEAARSLLTYAFAAEVIASISVASVRQQLQDAVLQHRGATL